MTKRNRLLTVDLFSGCGGMSKGFENAGFKIVGAFDNWLPALRTYRENFDHPAIEADLSDEQTLQTIVAMKPDVIIGGPPCQDFSSAGPNRATSKRAGMLLKFADAVERARPNIFVLENVPRARLTVSFKTALDRFRAMGFGITQIVLDSSYCGVPQVRKRLFVIGSLGSPDDFAKKAIEESLSKTPLTMRQYFGESLGTDFYFRVPTNYTRRGVFSIDEPCTTIRAVDRPIPSGYPCHPEDPAPIGPLVRALTVSERAKTQTFPESFVFTGSKTDLNKMIGNAVPVKLAEFVALAIRRSIENRP